MGTTKPGFGTAVDVLSKLLEGKKPKEVAHELGVSATTVSQAKEMFPLFLGLTRAYRKKADE
jgi:FixJ family two-component response regulator